MARQLLRASRRFHSITLRADAHHLLTDVWLGVLLAVALVKLTGWLLLDPLIATAMALHLLVPGHWSVQAGHDLCERIEQEIRAALPRTDVNTHLEPIEDPDSRQDTRFGWVEP